MRFTTADALKRTIGFMGIGLKAVYKRFSRMLVRDGLWRFSFEEPSQKGKPCGVPATGSFGWVPQPQCCWDTPGTSLTNDATFN